MAKRIILLVALVAIIALPFLLKPKHGAVERSDLTLVIITPHNEAIRSEFARGFRVWYRERTGKTVQVDWRVIGGTSDIARFLESEYIAAFKNYWTGNLGRPWSAEIQQGFTNPKLSAEAPAIVKEARQAFLASNVSCGIDLFFGGGSYDFIRQAQAGRLVAIPLLQQHPEWFVPSVIARSFSGEVYWDPNGVWFGNVLSAYGILYNKDSLARLGIAHPPEKWSDLTNPRYVGELALADPTKSGSMARAFEYIIQQQIQERTTAAEKRAGGSLSAAEQTQAVKDGWVAGLQIIQLIGANGRYFTDSSQKPPIDVSQGDCAAGISIDFYGRSQAEVTEQRGGGTPRLGFVVPRGGSVSSVDPIAVLRGAPDRAVAEAFIEYSLSMDGQKLWNFKPGTPGGPVRFALRRLPVRQDFYKHDEWKKYRSDPDAAPFADEEHLTYHPEWTSGIFREMAFVIGAMCLDPHDELVAAWRTIIAAGRPPQAMAKLSDMSLIDYARTNGAIKKALNSKDKVDEIRLASELTRAFRKQYREAEELARAGK
ncbi:MAG: extracellular solute-binding protein [Opitutaceae bacterium]